MALRYAVQDGDWSATTTWDGGTLPGVADDVWANGYDVVIDQNITVNSLRNDNSNGMTATNGKDFSIGASVVINANIDHSAVVAGITAFDILTGSMLNGITAVINGDIIESDPSYTSSSADGINLTALQDAHITLNGDIYIKRGNVSCTGLEVVGATGALSTFIHNGNIRVRDPNSALNAGRAVTTAGQQLDYTFTGIIENIDVAIGSSGNTLHCVNQFGTNTFDLGVSTLTGYIGSNANRIYSAAEGQTVAFTANEVIGKGGDYTLEVGTSSTCDGMSTVINADIISHGGKALYVTGEVNCAVELNGDIYRSSVTTTSTSVNTAYVLTADTTINGDVKPGGYGVGVAFNGVNVNRVINGTVYGETDGITGAIGVRDTGTRNDVTKLTIDTVDLTNTISTEEVIDVSILNTTSNTNVPIIKNVVGAVGVDKWISVNYVVDPDGTYTLPDINGGVTTFVSGNAGSQPVEGKVLLGTAYGNNKTGTLVLPDPATVLDAIEYGETGTTSTGTLVAGGGGSGGIGLS